MCCWRYTPPPFPGHREGPVRTGIVTNGRLERGDGHDTRGLFLNTLPVHLDGAAANWTDAARQAFAVEQELQPHRRWPGALLQRGRSTPLVSACFNYTSFHALRLTSSRQTVRLSSGFREQAHTEFPLLASFDRILVEGRQRISLILGVNEAIGPDPTREVYLDVLRALAAGQAPRQVAALPPGDVPLISDTGPVVSFPGPVSPAAAMVARAATDPAAVAVIAADERIDYGRLAERVRSLAARLRAAGAEPDRLVGVFLRAGSTR